MKLGFSNILCGLCVLVEITKNAPLCDASSTNGKGGVDSVSKKSFVIELEDSTFERKTQASSGGTSGINFLIKVYGLSSFMHHGVDIVDQWRMIGMSWPIFWANKLM